MISGTLAVKTILDWYRTGRDPDREISAYLGHVRPETYWYMEAVPELLRLACERAERNLGRREMKPNLLSAHLQRFFTERLVGQLQASSHTVASYRDTFRLLLRYAADQLARAPTKLEVDDIDAELIGRFLSFVETARANSARSRNTRLSAIRSFFKYVAIQEPQLLHHCQKILAMPSKRYEKRTIDFRRDEVEALVAAPDPKTWFGRRDRTLLLVAVQTGLRVSELINLACGDVVLGSGAHIRCSGKGRKERSTPLRKDSVHALRTWLAERAGEDDEPLFVSTWPTPQS